MAAPDTFSDAGAALGRSSSMDARDSLSRSDSQRKTKGGGKKGHRSGNELFVCFAPRTSLNLSSRSVLSPSREKGQKEHQSSRKAGKALSSSIFSKAGARKPGFRADEDEEEEPTSPKVTCIGQVRVKHKKSKEAAALYKGGKQPQRSLGQEGKQKESVCSSFGKDFSCFGLPCDSYGSLPSFRGDKKSGGAVFAKSLVRIQQETEEQTEPKGAPIKQQLEPSAAAAPVTQSAETVPKEQEQPFQAAAMPTTANTVGKVEKETLAKKQEDPVSETEVEEDDTFDDYAPPPNALLLMHSKAEHLRVSVPPPALNITLKRSTSAPVQSRSKGEQDGTHCEEAVVGQMEQQEHDPYKSSHDSQKSFFKRCKSVSQSFTRSISTEGPAHIVEKRLLDKVAEENNELPAPEAIGASNIKEDEETQGAQAILEMVNVGRSESESLKVSLDFVPETWLWEHCPIARPPKSEKRLVDNKQGVEWLDAELEASLWKSCKVSDPHRAKEQAVQSVCSDVNTAARNTAGVDAEVETRLWRSCGLSTSGQSDSQNSSGNAPKDGSMVPNNDGVAEEEAIENRRSISSLGRSFSVGNYGGRQLERGGSLCRSCSVGSQSGRLIQEGGHNETQEKGLSKMDPAWKSNVSKIQIAMGKEGKDLAVGIVQNGGEFTCYGDDCLCDIKEEKKGRPISLEEGINACEQGARPLVQGVQGGHKLAAVKGDPCSNPVEQPPAPAPSPSPGPETLLFVRYNLGAFHISIDAPDNILNTIEHKAGDKACMLQAVSHLHEVGSYARLLKASSGKEPVSLSSSAFQLPRCKSEPVRLTSY